VRSSPAIDRVVAGLRRLPGVGEKTATRLAFFLLSAPDAVVAELADSIGRLKRDVRLCERCFNLTESSPCALCEDPERDASLLCVVEEPADLASIERSGGFRGRYFVLGGAIAPMEGVGPDDLRVGDLEARIAEGEVREVILATNPNAEGDATAHYLAERLRPSGVKLTRIAYGMPLGGDFEYADFVTVGRSIQGRRELE
jgi:recombination protein RecR